jgi:hypothetical protein
MNKTSPPSAPERDWLLVGSQSITTSGNYSPQGSISGPIEPKHGHESLLRDYGDEASWSRRIEEEAWIHDLLSEVPDDEEE